MIEPRSNLIPVSKLEEIIGFVLNAISTGSIIAQKNNTAFRDAVSVFTGVFLPDLRSTVISAEGINRRRTNLVAQTLQDVIQIPAHSAASTIVLLPRTGILAFPNAGLDNKGMKVPVIIDNVLDVHLEPEVVTQVTATPVKKGECIAGNTKDQAREALGKPTGISTAADNTSTAPNLKNCLSGFDQRPCFLRGADGDAQVVADERDR